MSVRNRTLHEFSPRNLKDVVCHWKENFIEGEYSMFRDLVVDYCRNSPDITTAVTRACNSKYMDGKMHNHQSRVSKASRDELAKKLLSLKNGINHWDFHKLFKQIEECAAGISGIGPITIYDVATRIAAYFRIEPEMLYLHGGVRHGWEALIGRKEARKQIKRHELPRELKDCSMDEVEDMMCLYRNYLNPFLLQSKMETSS